jgi:hypothetical protein
MSFLVGVSMGVCVVLTVVGAIRKDAVMASGGIAIGALAAWYFLS